MLVKTLASAAIATAILTASTPAHAALTLVFEAFETVNGLTGGFTAVIPNLPLTGGAITSQHITECYVITPLGGSCSEQHYLAVLDNNGNGGDLFDALQFHAVTKAANFRFANGAFGTPGVHDTIDGWPNLGRLTVSGQVDGPPTDWLPAPIPEPATWAMMIMGFGAVGSMLRRRLATA